MPREQSKYIPQTCQQVSKPCVETSKPVEPCKPKKHHVHSHKKFCLHRRHHSKSLSSLSSLSSSHSSIHQVVCEKKPSPKECKPICECQKPVEQICKPVCKPVYIPKKPCEQITKPICKPVCKPVSQEKEPICKPVCQEKEPIEKVGKPVHQVHEPKEHLICDPVVYTPQFYKPVSSSVLSCEQKYCRPICKPIVETVCKPVCEPVSKPVSHEVREPECRHKFKHVHQQVREPLCKPVIKPVSKPVSKPVKVPVCKHTSVSLSSQQVCEPCVTHSHTSSSYSIE